MRHNIPFASSPHIWAIDTAKAPRSTPNRPRFTLRSPATHRSVDDELPGGGVERAGRVGAGPHLRPHRVLGGGRGGRHLDEDAAVGGSQVLHLVLPLPVLERLQEEVLDVQQV